MSINPAGILSILVAFQLLFVALFLFTHRKGNQQNNRLLGLVFLLFSLNLLDFTARISGFVFHLPLLHLLDDCFFFLYGPLLFFYTQGVAFRDFTLDRKVAWHFIPFGVVTLFWGFQLVSLDQEVQENFAEKMITTDLPAWVFVVNLVIYLHILAYLWLAWQTIKTYHKVIRDKFSSVDEINLDWLSFMIRTFTGITVVAMINNLVPVFGSTFFLYASIGVLLLLSFYFISLVLVKALNQPVIFSGIAREETERYAGSNLTGEEVDQIKDRLVDRMVSERPYLDADLKSKDLAAQLEVSPRVLSQVINQCFKQNFFDYINSYRCEEVQRILQGPDRKVTIIEAMYQAGFNSKSSFNKEFKKLTGQTPSEFKKSLS